MKYCKHCGSFSDIQLTDKKEPGGFIEHDGWLTIIGDHGMSTTISQEQLKKALPKLKRFAETGHLLTRKQYLELMDEEKPPNKTYSPEAIELVKKSKEELKKREAKGYTREQAIKEFFEILDEINGTDNEQPPD